MASSSFSHEVPGKSTEIKTGIASAADQVKNKAQELASSAAQKAQDVAANITHKTQEVASTVAHKAQDTTATAIDKTNCGIAAVGHQMTSLAGTLREATPPHGAMGSVATTVADNLQAGGRYLERHGVEDMVKDVNAVVRQYPLQSVFVSVGLGCLLGLALSRR